MIPKKPQFKTCFQVHVELGQVVLLDDYGEHHAIKGSIYVALAPYLSHKVYSTEEIVEQLKKKASQAEVYYALLRLQSKGLIAEAQENVSPEFTAFCHRLNVSVEEAVHRLQTTKICIENFGAARLKSFRQCCKELSIEEDPIHPSLKVAIVSHHCHEISQTKTPLLLIKPVGPQVWIGPPAYSRSHRLCGLFCGAGGSEPLHAEIKKQKTEKSGIGSL